jgi:hypothetical protein
MKTDDVGMNLKLQESQASQIAKSISSAYAVLAKTYESGFSSARPPPNTLVDKVKGTAIQFSEEELQPLKPEQLRHIVSPDGTSRYEAVDEPSEPPSPEPPASE